VSDAQDTPGAAHDAIHLPGPSWWPLLMAIGVALTLTGLIVNPIMLAIGAVLGVASLGLWVRDARRELRELDE